MASGIREFRSSISGNDDDDEEEPAAKPAQIEGAEQHAEPVETEVVADRRS